MAHHDKTKNGSKTKSHLAISIPRVGQGLFPLARLRCHYRPLRHYPEASMPETLIANPRLEFTATHRKSSTLEIPNRERKAISQSDSSTPKTHLRFSNRHTRHFRISTNVSTSNTYANSKRYEIALSANCAIRPLPKISTASPTRKQAFSIHGIIGFLCSV